MHFSLGLVFDTGQQSLHTFIYSLGPVIVIVKMAENSLRKCLGSFAYIGLYFIYMQ